MLRVDIELKNYRCFPADEPARFTLGPGFTALLGINNSGKSSLLKFFCEIRNVFSPLGSASTQFLDALRHHESPVTFREVTDQLEVFATTTAGPLEVSMRVPVADLRALPTRDENNHPVPEQLRVAVDRRTLSVSVDVIDPETRFEPGANLEWRGSLLLQNGDAVFDFGPWFDVFRVLNASLYFGAFRNAINIPGGDYYDIRVGHHFVNQWDEYKSGQIRAQRDLAAAVTEDIRKIFGFEVLDITANRDSTTLLLTIDGSTYRLDEVGGGLAHFTVVLATAALRSPTFILIDEPELNLHPALQLDFLATLHSYATHGVMFATHSFGLARAVGQHTYSLRRVRGGVTQTRALHATKSLAEFLGELGLSGFRELGYSKVILVEGPSDVAAYRQLFHLYQPTARMVFLPLGGSSTINPNADQTLAEVLALSDRVHGIVDSERAHEGGAAAEGRDGFIELCGRLGIQAFILERRAIENYLPDHAIKAVKGSKYAALGPYERLKDAAMPWDKSENLRIIGKCSKGDFAGTDLDGFVAHVLAEPDM